MSEGSGSSIFGAGESLSIQCHLGELSGVIKGIAHSVDRMEDRVTELDRKVSNGLSDRVGRIDNEVSGLKDSVEVIRVKINRLDQVNDGLKQVQVAVDSLLIKRRPFHRIRLLAVHMLAYWKLYAIIIGPIAVSIGVITGWTTVTEAATVLKLLFSKVIFGLPTAQSG